MKKALIWLVILGLGGLLAWQLTGPGDTPAQRARPPVPVTAYTVVAEPFHEEVQALGTLRAWESVDITASVSQMIESLQFDDGQQVEKGTVLAVLRQDAEQASRRELQATLADAEREVRRLENLARQNQVAQTELDRARTLASVTRHRIEEVDSRIADRTIVAPFAGTLGLRLVSEGALVTAGQRLTTLDDLSRLRLDFTVPERRLGFLRVGQTVTALTPAFEGSYTGTVTALDSRVDPVARSITARAEVLNPGQRLRPGMLLEVVIRGPERQALLVPEESLESRSTQHFVWRLDAAAGQAVRREVMIGGRRPGWVEVVGGLAAGDRVVRDGVGRLSGESAEVRLVGD
ncbi:MAG: efflux RND transporter periplasmic adaptor subunit [Haliea sp.]|uniref:efflux RND transporter periplasmic adaptor subunit n=1 Tax=Haliea sp. TaxID=1932666 RepID=UPI0032ECFB77